MAYQYRHDQPTGDRPLRLEAFVGGRHGLHDVWIRHGVEEVSRTLGVDAYLRRKNVKLSRRRRGMSSLLAWAHAVRMPFGSVFVMILVVAVVAGGTAIVLPRRAGAVTPTGRQAAAPTGRHTPVATRGPGPVHRPLPASAIKNHGYPQGLRPPVVPPGIKAAGPAHELSAQEWARVPKPASAGTAASASLDVTAGATNLILRSGFDFNDTSLVLYFDAAGDGISSWQSWKATVFDPDTGAGQDSVQLQPSDAALCQVPAQYCRSFGSADGWSLVGGHKYFVTITVTLNGGSQVVSSPSAQAAARTTSDPPTRPAGQLIGCSCIDALFATNASQLVRGSGVGTLTGTYSSVWPDLALPGFGVTFRSTRTYSSANTAAGVFGLGWSWSYDIKVIPPAQGQTAVTVRAEDGAQAVYAGGSNGAYVRPAGVRSELSAVAGGGWKLTTPLQETYNFDATGRLISELDSHGNGVRLTYTSGSITITDAAGRVVTGSLNASGLMTKLALPDKRNVIFKYTNGLLTSFQDAASNTWTYGYTSLLLTSIVDPMGRTQLTNTYSAGRVVKQVDASGAARTFSWNATTQEATTVDADGVTYFDGYRNNAIVFSQNGNGDTTNQRYDQAVDPNLLVDPQGNQTISSYDTSSNRLAVTAPDPFNFTVSDTFDAKNNLTTHADALGQVLRFGYTATNEISSILAPAGDNTTFTYDIRGLATRMTDPRSKVTTLAYDAAGNLISVTSAMGEVTTYTYDSSGRLITKVDPRGNLPGARALDFTTTYTYDNLDRVTGVLQPRKAHPSTTTYDSVGEVKQTADPVGHTTSYTYGAVLGRTLTITDPNLGVTTYTYTAAGREASVTDAVGGKTTMTYDNRGNIATVTSPGGNVPGANPADFTTTYTYDSNGNRVRTSHPYPGGGTVTNDTGYDQLNRATANTDQLGKTSTQTYNNNNDVTSTADPLGGTTTYTYDADGRPTAVTAPAGGSDNKQYDAAGNVIKATSAFGGITTYAYDDDGRVTSAVDPQGNVAGATPADHTVHYAYDAASNLTAVTDQLGKTTSFGYDSNNRIVSSADADGHTTTDKYLDDDTLQSVVGPDGSTQLATTYSYDNAGNVVSRTDALGNIRYTYDKLGRLVDVKDQLNHDTLFTYGAEGNLLTTVNPGLTDPSSRTITYTYDILDRLVSEVQGAGGPIYNWGYDAKNEITSLTDPSGVRSQSYDNLGRLVSVSRGGNSFGYGYDPDGNITSTTRPDGTTIASSYNTADQLTSLTAQGGVAGPTPAQYAFSYDPSGRLTKTTYPTANHLVTDRTYDQAGRLSDLNSHSDAGTVARLQITRDPVGNAAGITTSRAGASQHVAYTYDQFNRLTAACVGADCTSPSGKIAYTYDEVGNRLSQTLSGSAGNSQTAYTYNSASELTNSTITTPSGTTSTAFTYDPSGNLTQAGNNTFTYNLDHTMASATIGGSTTSYAYDAQGNQLSATNGTATRTWQTDVNSNLPQLAEQSVTSGGNTSTEGFVEGPYGTPLGLLTGGQSDSYVLDGVDGVANVVAPTGENLAEYDYDPFGNPRTDGTASGTPTVDNPIRFAGMYQDTTLGSQYSTLARAYDPSTGRFNGVDPAAPAINQPATSLYAYVGDRAMNYRDPSGASPCSANDEHDNAQLLALDIFALQYGRDNVYGDCPGWQVWKGIPGQLSIETTNPAAQPDILINAGGGAATLLYEVKPAANQFEPYPFHTEPRELENQNQVLRYIMALSYDTTGRFPNPQLGPNIVPASRQNADGSTTWIFSAPDWNRFSKAPPTIRSNGIIYYITQRPPRVKPPVPVNPNNGGNQNENQKQDPRTTPTQRPTDDEPDTSNDGSNIGEDILVAAAVVVVAIVVIALLPEEVVAGAAAAVAAGVGALASWAFSW
jgi:RHS repeat-associated protein